MFVDGPGVYQLDLNVVTVAPLPGSHRTQLAMLALYGFPSLGCNSSRLTLSSRALFDVDQMALSVGYWR